MTQEEIVKKRQELVHTMFSSTGEDFVRLVLENCRGGVSALSAEMRERMHAQEFDWNGFPWYKLRVGEPKGKTKKILYLHGGGWVMDSGVAQYNFAEYLATETGAEIWFPEYPIIPEHNGKEALDMAMALYREMLKECPWRGHRPGRRLRGRRARALGRARHQRRGPRQAEQPVPGLPRLQLRRHAEERRGEGL